MFKKILPPPPLLDQPEKQWSLSIYNFFMTPPPLTFLPAPLEINTDRSLNKAEIAGVKTLFVKTNTVDCMRYKYNIYHVVWQEKQNSARYRNYEYVRPSFVTYGYE